jgi:tRNA pseudouridine13 synthase
MGGPAFFLGQELRCRYVTTALPEGRIKELPEDFVVEEVPAYEPSGAGTHLFVRFTKTNLTTPEAVRAIARALGCEPRAAGFAGMKDKRAVTEQTVSLETPRGVRIEDLAARARSLALDGISVHAATPHGNKLKPGHLAGNRFSILIRGLPVDRVGEVEAGLAQVGREGVPNAYGSQRFGREGDNAARALAWLTGKERGPRDPRTQRFLWSALQSAVFNAVLEARRRAGTWATPQEGDLLKLRSSGGLFLCTDAATDLARAQAGELSPTGPMVGDRMRWPEGEPGRLERDIATQVLGSLNLSSTRRLGEGSRRALRLWVEELRTERTDDAEHQPSCLRVYFVLPKGAYATTVLSAVVDVGASRGASTSGGDEEAEDV